MAGQRTPKASRSCKKMSGKLYGYRPTAALCLNFLAFPQALFWVFMHSPFSGMSAFLFCGSLIHMPSSLCPLVWVQETTVRRTAIPHTLVPDHRTTHPPSQRPKGWVVTWYIVLSLSYLPLQWRQTLVIPETYFRSIEKRVLPKTPLHLYLVRTSLSFGGKWMSFS